MQIHPRVTRQSRDFVRTFERFRPQAVRSARGVWTIGYGHRRTARAGATVSQDDADALLAFDLSEVADAIEPLIFTPLEANAFDALLSFAFSVGADAFRGSEVLRRLNRGAHLAAAAALEGWRCADIDGDLQVVDALVRRRAVEKARFLTPASGIPPFAVPASPPLRKFTPTLQPVEPPATPLKRRATAPFAVALSPPAAADRRDPFAMATTALAETRAERLERVITGRGPDAQMRDPAPEAEPAPPPFVEASADPRPAFDAKSPFGPAHEPVEAAFPEVDPEPASMDVEEATPAPQASGRRWSLVLAKEWLERSTVYLAIAILGLGLFLVSAVCILDRPTTGLLALGLVGIVAMIPAAVRFAMGRR